MKAEAPDLASRLLRISAPAQGEDLLAELREEAEGEILRALGEVWYVHRAKQEAVRVEAELQNLRRRYETASFRLAQVREELRQARREQQAHRLHLLAGDDTEEALQETGQRISALAQEERALEQELFSLKGFSKLGEHDRLQALESLLAQLRSVSLSETPLKVLGTLIGELQSRGLL